MFGTPSGTALWWALVPGDNPLIRPSDRRQARLAAVFVALALIAAPLMAAYGFSYHASLTERAVAQQEERYQVEATLLAEAPVSEAPATAAWRTPHEATTPAEWSTRDGRQHQGGVPVSGGTNAGETTTIWVDSDGNRASAPLTENQTIAAAVMATLGIWLIFVAALAGIYVLMRVRLDRIRYAEWDREWRELDEHRT